MGQGTGEKVFQKSALSLWLNIHHWGKNNWQRTEFNCD